MKKTETNPKEIQACSTWNPTFAKLALPGVDVISDWFSDDHLERLEKIHGSGQDYSSYSVYEVYNSKGAL